MFLSATAVSQIKDTLKAGIASGEIAGGNLLVLYKGEEMLYHEDGLADREKDIPIARDSIFRLYSMTKPMTATAVMILLERGQLELFDPVSRFLPGFKNQSVAEDGRLVPVKRDVTVHDLLHMVSGLVYGGHHQAGRETEQLFQEIDRKLLSDEPMGTVEIANRLGRCPLSFQPGATWEYGTSADVLGAIVEVVSGMRFGEFLQKELFGPLGMHDTGFWVPDEKRGRLAKTYGDDGNGDLTLYTGDHLGINHQANHAPAYESGGAGLLSTIDDSAKFTTMLLNKGSLNGVQILRPRTVEYLTTATINARQQAGFDNWYSLLGHSYGNMMRIMTDKTKAGILGGAGEYGWDGWLGAYFANLPQEELSFLFMVQKKDAGTLPVTRKLRNIVLSTL